jgi:hypothetical protein
MFLSINEWTNNKPFKTHVHKGETSFPSVLPRSYERCDAENTLINVFRTFCERFWAFCPRFVNVSDRFVNVFRTFLTVLSTFSERFVNVCDRFVNVFRTFCQHFTNISELLVNVLRFVNVHTVRILCIVRKVLTRPFQRHLTWWGNWPQKRPCRSYNGHSCHKLHIVGKLLTRPFQRYVTWGVIYLNRI